MNINVTIQRNDCIIKTACQRYWHLCWYCDLLWRMRPVVGQGHKVWLYNRLVVGSIPTRGNEIFIYIYICVSSLWYRGKARRWVPPLNTQCIQNLIESGERSVLTLACLPCGIQREAETKNMMNVCWKNSCNSNKYISWICKKIYIFKVI